MRQFNGALLVFLALLEASSGAFAQEAQQSTISTPLTLGGAPDNDLKDQVITSLNDFSKRFGRNLGSTQVVIANKISVPSGASSQFELKNTGISKDEMIFVTNGDRSQLIDKADIDQSGSRTAFFPPGDVTIALVKKHKISDEKLIRGDITKSLDVITLTKPVIIDNKDFKVMVPVPQGRASEVAPRPEMLCGQDDRVASSDRRVGRITPASCTGWLISDRFALTAGHCRGYSVMEFQVPQSLPDGTPVPARPEDQYPIIVDSIVFERPGGEDHPCVQGKWFCNVANDWTLIELGKNSNSKKYPGEIQGYFVLGIPSEIISKEVTIKGYGLDFTPRSDTMSGLNADSQTQQSAAGQIKETHGDPNSSTGSYITYTVDAEEGASGAPIIYNNDGSEIAIGIHGAGGCKLRTLGVNFGMLIDDKDLQKALKDKAGIKLN